MTISELMQKNTPNADYEGWVTNDDYVLAVGINLTESATEKDYTVVQMGIAGLDAQLNPITVDKTYIRAGQSSMKTGNQRAFKATGDRYIGDPFQDYGFSHDVKFGSGNAGESSGIDIDLKKTGAAPTAFTYTATVGS